MVGTTSPLVAQIIGNLQYIGFYDFVLPWLFAFAVVYGILKTAGIFDGLEKVQVIISIVIAFFLTNYTPYGTTIGAFFSNLYGTGIFIIAGILLGILMLGLMFGGDWRNMFIQPLTFVLGLLGIKAEGDQTIVLGGLFFVIAIAVMLWAARNFGINFSIHISPDVISTALVLGVVVVAVVFLTKG